MSYLVSLSDKKFKVWEAVDASRETEAAASVCADPVAVFPATPGGWTDLETWMSEQKVNSFSASSTVHEWLVEEEI